MDDSLCACNKKGNHENKVYRHNLKKKQNFMAPFYGWGSTASRLEPLRGGSLLFTTKFPEEETFSLFSTTVEEDYNTAYLSLV